MKTIDKISLWAGIVTLALLPLPAVGGGAVPPREKP
jgi:hypothetical protein